MLLNDFNRCISGKWMTSPKGVQYYLESDGALYFQASVSFWDWLFNLYFLPTFSTCGGNLIITHRGFDIMWDSVKNDIEKLSFTRVRGFSQGAVFAIRAYGESKQPCDCIVFGCPKFILFPSKAVRKLLSTVTRFQNYNDIVTKMAPWYTHIGKAITFHAVHTRPKGVGILEWISGHSPKQYRKNLGGVQ